MDNVQKLVVARAAKDELERIEREVKQLAVDELRAKLPDGGNQRVFINGVEVGTLVLNAPKTTGGGKSLKVYMKSRAQYHVWLNKCRRSLLREYIEAKGYGEDFARWYIEQTGETPEGIEANMVEEPVRVTQGSSIRGVKFNTVKEALGTQLPSAMNLVLEAGNE